MISNIAILGAGFVGASLAVGLSKLGFQVTVIEKREPSVGPESFGVDVRSVAISPASRSYLESLDIWPQTLSEPYFKLSIWENRGISDLEFDSAELRLENLGSIVEASKYQTSIWEKLDSFGVVKLLGSPSDLSLSEHGVDIGFADRRESFDLLIGADGVNSFVRRALSLPMKKTSTGQFALATIIRSERDHNGCALQRFLEEGPVAALPSKEKNVRTIIWSQNEKTVKAKMEQSDQALNSDLEAVFGERVGRIQEIGKRFMSPLAQQRVKDFMPERRVIMIGDAARTIHPLAGFGANLGFEDARELIEVARLTGLEDPKALLKYAKRREARSDFMIFLMETILGAYTRNSPFLSWLRNVAVGFVDENAWIKNQIVKEASGYGPASRF